MDADSTEPKVLLVDDGYDSNFDWKNTEQRSGAATILCKRNRLIQSLVDPVI